MSAKVFVDTNVLVYTRDASETAKQEQALRWMTYLWNSRSGRLSFQVLQEFYVTVTRKLRPGMEAQEAREDVRWLLSWNPISVDARVLDGAWRIQDRFNLAWWDALIASAATIADCRYLLSEDFQENQEFGDVRVINPFSSAPESLDSSRS